MNIYHFTRREYLEEIKKSGFIELERMRNPLSDTEKHLRGRLPLLVWFTKSTTCRTASGTGYMKHSGGYDWTRFEYKNVCALKFDDTEIKAIPWLWYKNKFSYHKRTYQYIKMLDFSARHMGDDPNDFYVCEYRVPIDKGEIVNIEYSGPNYVDAIDSRELLKCA